MTRLNIKLLDDRVVIRQKEAPETFKDSAIAIPDTHQHKHRPSEGEVMAVGPGLQTENSILRKILKFLVWAFTFWLKGIGGTTNDKGVAVLIPAEFSSFDTMTVKPGDWVKYGQHAGTKIEIDGQEYIMIRQTDVFYVDMEATSAAAVERVIKTGNNTAPPNT